MTPAIARLRGRDAGPEHSSVHSSRTGEAGQGEPPLAPLADDRRGTERPPSPASPVILTLPVPPSVNEMFSNKAGRGRIKTRAYLDWRGHAAWRIREQRPPRIDGHVVISLAVERVSLQADIDNRVKAIFDALVAAEVIEDDRFVVGFCIAWSPPASRLARVMILPAGNYDFQFQLAKEGTSGGWFMTVPHPEQEIA